MSAYTVNDGNGGGNYVVSTNTASGSISQALLTINAATDSEAYDGTTDSDEHADGGGHGLLAGQRHGARPGV